MTDRDFCRADGNTDIALKDSKESVLELCLLSSAVSLFAAARSNLKKFRFYNYRIFYYLTIKYEMQMAMSITRHINVVT